MQYKEQWAEELALLSSIIAKAPLERSIKWGMEVFTYQGRNVLSYGGFKNHFAIWFNNGVFLEDKDQLLVTASGGKTKSLRQWRFTSKAEVDEKKILAYIQEAITVEKKGLKIRPEKFTPVPPPELLLAAFKTDKELEAAFAQLTPGKQKEYIVYLNEARQDTTRENRLAKIKPMIMAGAGLNDKYRK